MGYLWLFYQIIEQKNLNSLTLKKVTVIPTQRLGEVYSYDLKKMLESSKDFNPSIVQKKNNKISQNVPISLHRYITGRFLFFITQILPFDSLFFQLLIKCH